LTRPPGGEFLSAQLAVLAEGKLTLADEPVESLRQAALMEPPGVYTVARTYQRERVVLLDAHFDRLEESARLVGVELQLDRPALRRGLSLLVGQCGYANSRFRITLPLAEPQTPRLAIEPLVEVPAELRRRGVVASTIRLDRSIPAAKSNAWEARRQAAWQELPPDTYEGLLVDPGGRILEGFTSNVYAVHEGRLLTAERGILKGISRRILFEVLPPSMPVSHEGIPVGLVPTLEEAFLSSSSRGLLPIVRIDDLTIGRGRPGGWTIDLMARYDAWVEAHLEPIIGRERLGANRSVS
jgi:branched-chain amino acid aminotransferase